MRRVVVCVSILGLVLGVFVAGAYCQRADREVDGVAIVISPQTLALSSIGGCVSVHSNIPLGLVNTSSIALEDLRPYLVKADSRGDLVAKFDLAAVKDIVSVPEATLTLTGVTVDGVPFAASDTIRVIE